jgi:hypothetical protein
MIGEPWFPGLTLKTASFSCTLIYAARLLPADILSVCDVLCWQLAYSIASSTKQINRISHICYKQMVITPRP